MRTFYTIGILVMLFVFTFTYVAPAFAADFASPGTPAGDKSQGPYVKTDAKDAKIAHGDNNMVTSNYYYILQGKPPTFFYHEQYIDRPRSNR
jgi:hypothetical protein